MANLQQRLSFWWMAKIKRMVAAKKLWRFWPMSSSQSIWTGPWKRACDGWCSFFAVSSLWQTTFATIILQLWRLISNKIWMLAHHSMDCSIRFMQYQIQYCLSLEACSSIRLAKGMLWSYLRWLCASDREFLCLEDIGNHLSWWLWVEEYLGLGASLCTLGNPLLCLAGSSTMR